MFNLLMYGALSIFKIHNRVRCLNDTCDLGPRIYGRVLFFLLKRSIVGIQNNNFERIVGHFFTFLLSKIILVSIRRYLDHDKTLEPRPVL